MGHQMKLARETLLLQTGTESTDVLDLVLPRPDIDIDDFDPDPDLSLPSDSRTNLHASEATVLLRRSGQDSPRAVLTRLIDRSRVIELSVVDFDCLKTKIVLSDLVKNNHALSTPRKIRLFSPDVVRPHCVNVTEHRGEIVIDFLSLPGFQYTIALPMDVFFAAQVNLTDSNARKWRAIRRPYAFDLRKPLMMHAVSSDILIVGLKDGGLIRLKRKSPLMDVEASEFKEERSFISKMLPWGSDRIPGNSKISARAAVSMAHSTTLWGKTSNGVLVTVTVGKKLRVWSIDGLDMVSERELLGEQDSKENRNGPPSSSSNMAATYLDPTPTRLVQFARDMSSELENENEDKASKTKYLVTLLPTGRPQFKLWEFRNTIEELNLIDAPAPSDNGAVWFIRDFLASVVFDPITPTKPRVGLVVGWKCDKSSRLMQMAPYHGRDRWYEVQEDAEEAPIQPWEDITGATGCISRIFGPGGYSRPAIAHALSSYAKLMKTPAPDVIASTHLSLEEQVQHIVGGAVSISSSGDFETYNKELTNQWRRFERFCAEIDKQGKELLTLAWHTRGRWLVIRSQFVCVSRGLVNGETLALNAGVYELADRNRTKHELDSILRFIDAIHEFRRQFPLQVVHKIVQALRTDFGRSQVFLVPDRMNKIFNEHIEPHMSGTMFEKINVSINQLDDIDRIIESVLTYMTWQSNDEDIGVLLFGSANSLIERESLIGPNALGSHLLNAEVHEICTTCVDVVIDVIFVLLLASADDGRYISKYDAHYTNYLSVFKTLSGILELQTIMAHKGRRRYPHNASSNEDQVIDRLSSLSVDDQLVVNDCEAEQPSFCEWLLRKFNITSFSQAWQFLSLHHYSLATNSLNSCRAAIEMLAYCRHTHLSTEFVRQYITLYFNGDYVSTFVHGCLLLACGSDRAGTAMLRRASLGLATKNSKAARIALSEEMSKVIRLLGSTLPKAFGHGYVSYYRAVANYAAKYSMKSALELGSCGIQMINGSFSKELPVVQDLLEDVIIYGLQTRSFDDAYNALSELSLTACPKDRLDSAIEKFIDLSASSGHALKMCKLPFVNMTDTVSDVITRRAKSNSHQSSVDYYQILYAWTIEHGNFTGAHRLDDVDAETLLKKYNLLNQALNALNCIQEPKDRWIVVEKKCGDVDESKRRKLEGMTNGSQTVVSALTYKDIVDERANIMSRLNQFLTQRQRQQISN